MKIALGAAMGLAFLHSAETKVIYRDFKTSNILLDSVCTLRSKYEAYIFMILCPFSFQGLEIDWLLS